MVIAARKVGLLVAVMLILSPLGGQAYGSFGFQGHSLGMAITESPGVSDVRAGSHPFEMTTSFAFNTKINSSGETVSDGDLKDLAVELPAGFIGDPAATPKCTATAFHTQSEVNVGEGSSCPSNTQVGTALVTLGLGAPGVPLTLEFGVYNLVPPPNAPAAFGFNPFGLAITLIPSVRTGQDNGVTVRVANVSQAVSLVSSIVTLWGVPGEASHNGARGKCIGIPACEEPADEGTKPFLRLPTSCSGAPLLATIHADSWQEPGNFVEANTFDSLTPEGPPALLEGCDRLDFSPSLSLIPETTAANTPTAVNVDLKMPQNENPHGLAEADLKDVSVTLPTGLAVNPPAADGLVACSQSQIELNGPNEPTCPDASKIGTVEVTTPLLEAPLQGAVYQAEQNNNPFHSLLAFYIVARGPGVTIKLPGKVTADPITGRLTTSVAEAPQLPFGDFKLSFFGGPRAALTTTACGAYAASASLSPWSGTPAVSPAIQPFTINENCGGGFAPSFAAGTSSNQADSYSPFSVTLSRTDQEQNLGQVSVHMPPGVLGMLSKVSVCGEPQAEQGTCSAASQIGHVIVGAGTGSDPLYVPQAGKPQAPVFLTGPYKGAPYGLLIAVPAQAGPFDLGVVKVRAAIYVDPHTAQLTVVSDPLPRIVQGIPLNVRTVNVMIDRSEFTFNPTNCEPLAVTGTIASTQGASANVSSHFQAANCAVLPFHPTFKVTTQGATSKKGGASLDVKVGSATGQANIRRVAVSLPKQLPSRLTTIQQACPEATFAANPATCPAGSNVGRAKAVTPVLNVPLEGPAYLVSHGGAAFPDLVVVLEGEGLRLDLVGNINISKKGITSSTFAAVPDAPISSFELKLPEGPHSALTTDLPAKAKRSLCGQKLAMPTTMTGQNGAQVTQSTTIVPTGCPKAKKTKASPAGRKKKKKK